MLTNTIVEICSTPLTTAPRRSNVRMDVRMCGWTYGRADGRMGMRTCDRSMDVRVDGCTYVHMHVRMDVRTDGWIHVRENPMSHDVCFGLVTNIHEYFIPKLNFIIKS